jgi:Domain of unknown function (DUF4263)
MLLKDKLTEVLNQTRREREIHDFLKKEPWIVWATFMRSGGHSKYVIPEFSVGKHRADFVVMKSFSGGWNIAFIELKSVDEKPFTKGEIPSKDLRGAIKQIDDWKTFQDCERASLCSHLADAAQKYDILYPEQNLAREPSCVKMPLRDPRTYLCFEYFIVMGRRSNFDEDENLIHVKSRFFSHHEVEILTYDRFIQTAEDLQQQNERYKSRTIEEKDKDFLAQFTENPKQFSISGGRDIYKHPSKLDIHGTCYKIRPNEREPGFIVDILDATYEIFEDRRRFQLNRIEPDGLALPVADDLESLCASIRLAEIFERFIDFHIDTEHSLDLVDECLQFLRKNPPYKVVNPSD